MILISFIHKQDYFTFSLGFQVYTHIYISHPTQEIQQDLRVALTEIPLVL